MIVRKTRIRNLSAYIGGIPIGAEFRPIVELDETGRKKLARIGFTESPSSGETVLPNGIGPISRFNADGKWQVHRLVHTKGWKTRIARLMDGREAA